MNKILTIFSALLISVGISTISYAAGTATAIVNVTASVTQKCKITTTDVLFGSYDPVVTNLTVALNAPGPGTIVITCTKNSTGVTISLNFGSNSAGAPTRNMKESAGALLLLPYQLYQPSNANALASCVYPGTVIWGDGTGGSLILTPTATAGWGSSAPKTFNVCGTVPAGQDVEAGSYSDIVTATVSF